MDGVRIKKMSGSKAPDYDTYGLLRTTCSHNPTQHSHIMVLTPHFYAHIGGGGTQGHSTTSVRVHVVSDLLTLVSLKIT